MRDNDWDETLGPQFLVDCFSAGGTCGGEWPTDALSKQKIFNI